MLENCKAIAADFEVFVSDLCLESIFIEYLSCEQVRVNI